MAARFCDRLLLLDRGRLAADGAPTEVLTSANLQAVYGIQARIEDTEVGPLIVPVRRIVGHD